MVSAPSQSPFGASAEGSRVQRTRSCETRCAQSVQLAWGARSVARRGHGAAAHACAAQLTDVPETSFFLSGALCNWWDGGCTVSMDGLLPDSLARGVLELGQELGLSDATVKEGKADREGIIRQHIKKTGLFRYSFFKFLLPCCAITVLLTALFCQGKGVVIWPIVRRMADSIQGSHRPT